MQGIMSGLEPTSQRNEEEVLERMLKDRSILELEDRLGIKIPTSKDQSEEDLINRILEMTGRPISKRGDEFVYAPTRPNFGRDDGLSFYVNPKINGAGIRYSKNFADGGIASFADGGSLNKKDGGIVKLQEGGDAGTKYFGKDGLLFDYSNPLDWAMFIPGIGWAGAGIKALSVGNRLRKLNKSLGNVPSKVINPLVEKGGILRNPLTKTASSGALAYTLGDATKEALSEMDSELKNPNMAYLDEDTGNYFYYDPEDEDYYLFENNEVPEGYKLEQ